MVNLNASIVRKFIFILFVITIFGLQGCEQEPLKTLKITYKTTYRLSAPSVTDFRNGERFVFIDMEQNKMKLEDWKEKYGANSMWANQIFDGEKLYDLDEDKKEAAYYVYEDTIKPIWEYQKRFDSVIKESNFIGKEKIAGEECKIYELETNDGYVKIWLWNNIILKGIERAKDSGGSIEETWEAVKIEKNLTFEDNLFTLPQGYTAISQQEYRSREDVQELESMFEEIDKAQQENSE